MMDNDKGRTPKKYILIILVVIPLLFSCLLPQPTGAFSPQVIQKGATGDDVIELQARLQYIGYYTGKIDGVYGWGTYWSVRNFQNDFGIEVDGKVGDEMKSKLTDHTEFDKQYVYSKIEKGEKFDTYGDTGKGPKPEWGPPGQRDPGTENKGAPAPEPSEPAPEQAEPTPEAPEEPAEPAPEEPAEPEAEAPSEESEVGMYEEAVNVPEGFSENDIRLMANAVYGEARGEPYEGQVAVAAVILNRVNHEEFPNTVSDVIFEPLAFTAVADGQIWMQPNEEARRAVMDAINGWDPSDGLVFYFNPDTATSAWMHQREPVKRIGKHVFLQ